MSKEETTSVQEVEVDLDELLGTGASAVMLPEEGSKEKKSIFLLISADTTFLDKPPVDETTSVEEKTPEELEAEANKTPEEIQAEEVLAKEDVLAPPTDDLDLSDDKNKGGRPTALVSTAKKLIEKGSLMPFEDDKKIEDYTAEDFQELIEANLEQHQAKAGEQVANQFFEQLPPEMQQAYTYIANGGTDLRGMFHALAASNEVRDLDITKEAGQKHAIRAYLSATNYGTPEEIEDEIYTLEDRGELDKKAKQFKPKLDAMQQDVVNRKVAEQDAQAKQRQAQSQNYIESVYSTLEEGKLNGLAIDNKTQNMLYAGLVQSNYPSISGKQTNMLGHLLEKYQWVEPRHDLIAEALWLLADPDGYKTSIGSGAEKETTEKTLRALKTEQSTKTASSSQEESTDEKKIKRPGIQRQKRNFFGRG